MQYIVYVFVRLIQARKVYDQCLSNLKTQAHRQKQCTRDVRPYKTYHKDMNLAYKPHCMVMPARPHHIRDPLRHGT